MFEVGKKKKKKKVNPKKEKYSKYHREKPATMDIHFPELSDEQSKTKRVNEDSITKYLRFNRNKPTKSLLDKRKKTK